MLYIMRHGKTDWNAMHKLQGQIDICLNEDGRAMSRRANEEYKDVHLDICFCSPLKRARETAELVLEGRDIPVVTDDRLKEMAFGKYEGLANSFQLEDCHINELFWHPESYLPDEDGGESLDELFARTGAFLEEKVRPLLEEGKDILIIGHGAMNHSIECQVSKRPLKDFWITGIENCKLYRLL